MTRLDKVVLSKLTVLTGVGGDLIPPAGGDYFDNTWWETKNGDVAWDGSKWTFSTASSFEPITSGPNVGWHLGFRPSKIGMTFTADGDGILQIQLSTSDDLVFPTFWDVTPLLEDCVWTTFDILVLQFFGNLKGGFTAGSIDSIYFLP